jgi:hypothetical protein
MLLDDLAWGLDRYVDDILCFASMYDACDQIHKILNCYSESLELS